MSLLGRAHLYTNKRGDEFFYNLRTKKIDVLRFLPFWSSSDSKEEFTFKDKEEAKTYLDILFKNNINLQEGEER